MEIILILTALCVMVTRLLRIMVEISSLFYFLGLYVVLCKGQLLVCTVWAHYSSKRSMERLQDAIICYGYMSAALGDGMKQRVNIERNKLM